MLRFLPTEAVFADADLLLRLDRDVPGWSGSARDAPGAWHMIYRSWTGGVAATVPVQLGRHPATGRFRTKGKTDTAAFAAIVLGCDCLRLALGAETLHSPDDPVLTRVLSVVKASIQDTGWALCPTSCHTLHRIARVTPGQVAMWISRDLMNGDQTPAGTGPWTRPDIGSRHDCSRVDFFRRSGPGL